MECFQQLLIHVRVLEEKCPLLSAGFAPSLAAELNTALSQFAVQAGQLHRTLAKTFNFLPEPPEDETSGRARRGFFEKIGERLERIVAIPTRIPSAELQKYAKAVHDLFLASQMIDTWIDFSNRPNEAREGEKHEMIGAYIHGREHLTAKLKQISDFMYHVVVKIVARDFRRLTERYLRKTRKTFTRMYIQGETYQ